MLSRLPALLKTRKPLYSPVIPSFQDLTQAAVLVLLHKENGEDQVVLTKRSQHVLHHKGQICFPGGAYDDGDSDLWRTALRETEEEVGLPRHQVELLGHLSPLVTPTGFFVQPYVGMVSSTPEWKTNPREIESLFSVPLRHFLHPENMMFVKRSYQHEGMASDLPCEIKEAFLAGYDDPLFTYQGHQIWGATARILFELLELLKAPHLT